MTETSTNVLSYETMINIKTLKYPWHSVSNKKQLASNGMLSTVQSLRHYTDMSHIKASYK